MPIAAQHFDVARTAGQTEPIAELITVLRLSYRGQGPNSLESRGLQEKPRVMAAKVVARADHRPGSGL